jgi:hypothetical protein
MIFFLSLVLNICFLSCIGIIAAANHQQYLAFEIIFLNRPFIVLLAKAIIGFAAAVLLHSTILPFLWWECRLRCRFGFQDLEVYIAPLPKDLQPGIALALTSSTGEGQGEEACRRRWVKNVVKAVELRSLYYRPSSLPKGTYWTPNYEVMWECNSLMCSGELVADDFGFGLWSRELQNGKGGWAFMELGEIVEPS